MFDSIRDDSGIMEGGIYLILTVLIAMVVYLVFLPILEPLYPLLTGMDADATARYSGMVARTDKSIGLYILLPLFSIVTAVIYFVARAIKQQAYSEYER